MPEIEMHSITLGWRFTFVNGGDLLIGDHGLNNTVAADVGDFLHPSFDTNVAEGYEFGPNADLRCALVGDSITVLNRNGRSIDQGLAILHITRQNVHPTGM